MAATEDSSSRKQQSYKLRSIALARTVTAQRIAALVAKVDALDSQSYDWSDRAALGITQGAWERVHREGLPPTRVFCHADVLLNDTTLIGYYRGLTMLPLKGMAQLAAPTDKLERGTGKLTKEKAQKISFLLNQFISTLVENVPEFLSLAPDSFVTATMAVTTDGRWRNAIGDEATRMVKEMIVGYLKDNRLVARVRSKSGEWFDSPQSMPIDEISSVQLTNDWVLAFGSEPDIEIRDPGDMVCEAFEIKGGLDPAGALERYGAAKKSFAKARARNSGVRTTLVMSAITDEVQGRAAQNTEVHDLYNLDDLLLDDKHRAEFLHNVRYKARL